MSLCTYQATRQPLNRRPAGIRITMSTRKPWSLLGTLLILLVSIFQTPAIAKDQGKAFFNALEKRLVADGFDPERIKSLYQSDDVFFESKGVSLYFLHNEATLNYKKMTKRSWIQQGRVYMQQQDKALQKALKEYGVDPNVITAIILVETKFGRYVGNQSIISILSTMATLRDAKPREYLWRQLPADRRLARRRYDKKADQKSDWAYRELKALLTYSKQHQIDVLSLKGSYAGALGIAQFMPSNILAYGQDGNGDGRIDLFDDADAIVSIASYLKHFGWKPGLKRRQAYKVVYHYNHSKYYVNTILEIADLLEG
jgi:membrane-bound lytic murein transglycosylase B